VLAGLLLPNAYRPWVFVGALLLVDPMFLLLRRVSWTDAKPILRRSLALQMVALLAAVFVLMGMIHVSDASRGIGQAMRAYHVPPALVAFLLPFVMGVLTGWTGAALGMTLPFLVEAGAIVDARTIMLAYTGSMFGVLASPVHLCLILTKEHFKADLPRVYRGLVPPLIGMTAAAAALALVL